MSYYAVCAANPQAKPCEISCTCQGHYKVYPNQACTCPYQPGDDDYEAASDLAESLFEKWGMKPQDFPTRFSQTVEAIQAAQKEEK